MTVLKKVACEKCKMPRLFYRYMDKDLSAADVRDLKLYLSKYRSCRCHLRFEKSLRRSFKVHLGAGALSGAAEKRIRMQIRRLSRKARKAKPGRTSRSKK